MGLHLITRSCDDVPMRVHKKDLDENRQQDGSKIVHLIPQDLGPDPHHCCLHNPQLQVIVSCLWRSPASSLRVYLECMP